MRMRTVNKQKLRSEDMARQPKVFVLLFIFFVMQSPSDARGPPNILFMMADQMRSDALSCAGNPAIKTPNLDALAAEGVRFSNAFSSTPSCTPARAAILTGLSPWYHGMLGYGAIATRYPYELPRALATAGYFTCSLGKDHYGWNTTSNEGIPHGYDKTDLYDGLPEEDDDYDKWFAKGNPGVDPMATGLEYNDYRGRAYVLNEYYHPTAYVGRAAIDFLKTYNRTSPFFLKVSFHRPHSPYDPPGVYMDQYDPASMPDPYIGGNWDTRYAVNYNTTPNPGIWCGNISLDTVRVSRQAYYGNVGFIDSWVGEILTTLQEQGMADNTFVLFTADHGDMLGDHYHFRKTFPYFGSAHIPMMFRWPIGWDEAPPLRMEGMGTVRGSMRDEVVELRDLFPTFLDVASLQPSSTLNGSSLLDLLRDPASLIGSNNLRSHQKVQQSGQATVWRTYLDLEHSTCYNITNHWNALTDGHTKYIFRAYFDDEQLFDLDSDPHEMTNLVGEPNWQSTLELWRERMVEQFEREMRGPDWVQDGKLMRRTKGQVYSPNYPHTPPPSPNIVQLTEP